MIIVVNHVELLSVSSVLQTSYLANLEKKERTSWQNIINVDFAAEFEAL